VKIRERVKGRDEEHSGLTDRGNQKIWDAHCLIGVYHRAEKVVPLFDTETSVKLSILATFSRASEILALVKPLIIHFSRTRLPAWHFTQTHH
jgi:hypothetical protein